MRLVNLYIYTTKNNSIITLTTANNRTIATETGGSYSPNDRDKSSVYYFITVFEKILSFVERIKATHLAYYIRSKGGNYFERFGPGLPFILKKIKELKEVTSFEPIRNTPLPHGGTKKPYGRRGRRK